MLGRGGQRALGAARFHHPRPRGDMAKLWLLVFFSVLAWSAIYPKDYFTWALEVAPAVLGLLVLWTTRRPFPLTTLAYVLILLHCIILMVGGHYTYAQVPLFDWLNPVLGTGRNNFDKLGHFAQGFVPAVIAREVVLRKRVFNRRGWAGFFVVCFCLALSAAYEMIEWAVALLSGGSAEAFLGTQGYAWDTQSDMAVAGLGAVCALVLLRRFHDRQLRKFSSL